jgi:fructose-bisphosphate aldolase class 1
LEASSKGLLAMDESNSTCRDGLANLGIGPTTETRP